MSSLAPMPAGAGPGDLYTSTDQPTCTFDHANLVSSCDDVRSISLKYVISRAVVNLDQLWSARDSPGVFPGPHASWGWSRGPIHVHRPAYMPIRACEPGLLLSRSSVNFGVGNQTTNLLEHQWPCMGWVLPHTGRLPQSRWIPPWYPPYLSSILDFLRSVIVYRLCRDSDQSVSGGHCRPP